MEKVFIARHPAEAQFVKGLLENEEIECEVQGAALFSVRGEAPATSETLPSIWIRNEQHVALARDIVARYERDLPSTNALPSWRCPRCGELLEPQFSNCWNCDTARSDAPEA